MPNTYTQIHIQFVFAVKFRHGLISSSWKDELYQYITGIVQNNKHKLICINGMPDHIHILIGVRPHQSISDLMQDVKGGSSKWINEKKFLKGKFEWQQGYGAFSYSKSHVKDVVHYIQNQERHHQKKTFLQEYVEFLEKFEVEYEESFIFKELI
ncbi:MAG: IS200/IS605 family transposase [Bacteroidia bacterium]|nr:IS200/IS605 family transposase [Bacteroidia bacterium]MBP7260606.1 IS200/IS605 family transposase [Bacteroidia bacterium]MBP9179866.1 IS200/IS605 family transposase [Bacteroidia bacterium]MBP9724228.1 IS200/IS605 family transposase [Bacteroidia bacterium]